MKIILLKDVAKVGKKYDMKDISDGYAINLLIPKGLAIVATPDAVKRIELEKAKDEGEKKIHHELLVKNLKELDGITVTLIEKTNDKGHLFAGINKLEIVQAIQKQTRLQIAPEFIALDKPIKEAGVCSIQVKAHDITVKFNLEIKPQ